MQRRGIIEPQREIRDPKKARQFIIDEPWAPEHYRRNLVKDLTDEEAVLTAETILEAAIDHAIQENNLLDPEKTN